jgi:hypothetical protein
MLKKSLRMTKYKSWNFSYILINSIALMLSNEKIHFFEGI